MESALILLRAKLRAGLAYIACTQIKSLSIISLMTYKTTTFVDVLFSDCPSAATVTPSSGPFRAGDVLSCTSDGYPEPSYTWTNSDGNVVSTGRTIVLPAGSFSLTCTVTGNLATPCSASTTVSGNAIGKNIQHHHHHAHLDHVVWVT